jgi:2-desacetyl-2-hydroxyethyl bacteriochlorophyllide A dehydrogenase
MRALICEAPGQLALAERERPARAPGEVLVRIRRVGVCGTDYHIYGGTQPYLSYPRVMGHELAGEVAEADPESGFKAGDRVCILPYLACGECVACRRGKSNCCMRIAVLGVHRDGGFAEYLSVPASAVLPADGLTLEQAAMVEFLAIGRHAVMRGDTKAGQRALVVGAGPIGMAVALFASDMGAEVSVVEGRADRALFCRERLGVRETFAPGPELRDQLAAATGDEFFDIVFDATGNRTAMEAGFGFLAHGGTYVLVSIVQGAISFEDPEFHKRETSLHGSRNATRADFDAVIEAIRAGRVPTDALHTHSAPLDAAAGILPQWAEAGAGVIKAIVEM